MTASNANKLKRMTGSLGKDSKVSSEMMLAYRPKHGMGDAVIMSSVVSKLLHA
jgi:hypothetical protein